MPSTYTTDLRLEQQANGENSSTWGTKFNASIQQIEDAVAGYLAVATTGGTTTLTTVNGGTDQARYAILKITGALVSNATIVAPDVSKEYIIWNATTNAYTVTVKNTSGTGVVVTQGAKVHLFCDGAEMYVAAVSLAGTEALTNKTYNGNTWTAGTGVLTIGAGKTATFNNTLTFSGTDGQTMTFPSTSATIARIDAANTFTGLQTFSTGITSTAASNSFGASVFSGNITSSGNPSLNIGTGALTAGAISGTTYQSNGAFTVTGIAIGSAASRWIGTDGSVGLTINVPTSASLYQSVNNAVVTTTSSTGLAVTGALSKSSGSFRIAHPIKPDTHELVHSFLEGPQADLIYRGKVLLVNGAAQVNIDTAAGMSDGTFEALCREVQVFTTNESGWNHVRGSVTGNTLTIECQDTTATDLISWMVIGERKDQHMYETEWTDEDGKVIVEPEKA